MSPTRGRFARCFALCTALSACADDAPAAPALADAGDSSVGPQDAGALAPPWDGAALPDAAPVDASTTDAEVDAGPALDPSTLDFAPFDDAIEDFVRANMLKGASAVVVHRDLGEIYRKGYGQFSAERVYLIASSSKILSVGVMLRLADQGLVDFDEPVDAYLSAWGSFKTDVTLAQMFSNSAGMVSLTDNPLYLPYICQYTTGGTVADCAKTIYTATDTADRKPPDSEFHYGGGPWQLGGGVGEVVSGKAWADLIRETYTEPCGMSSLGYTNQFQDATLGSLGLGAVSYPGFFAGDPASLPVTKNPSVEGGAYLTVADYGKLLWMHLRGGLCGDKRVLSAEAVARMQVDRIGEVYDGSTPSVELAGYGMGWWVDREHPGVVVDPGAYGSVAYLDTAHHYAAFIAVEAGSGTALFAQTKPALDAVLAP